MLAALVALVAFACSAEPPPNPRPAPAPMATAHASAVTTPSPTPSPCTPPAIARRSWNHKRSALVASLGKPHHGAIDPIVLAGELVSVPAKFTYGAVSKDLQDEDILLLRAKRPVAAGACAAWHPDGAGRTDDDGRVIVPLGESLRAPGRYPFALMVAGDDTMAMGAAWVVAPKQRVVVFDIDGTLTKGDEALVEQLLSGHSPEPRSGAAKVVNELAANGALPVYITGRPHLLAGMTRAWLTEHGFPPGPVRMTTDTGAAMPTDDGVQKFKLETLRMLQDKGVVIERVYGNAVTDICAYAQAGIPANVTFIAGRHGGEGCEGSGPSQAIGSGYDAHLTTLP
jgi:hypothetical protein